MLGAGLLGAAVGGVAVDAAHAPEVRAAIGGAVGNVGNAVGNVTGKAVGFVAGVAHRCRGKLSRFNPYKKPEAAAQLPNLVPIPLMPPHAIELRVDMLPLTPDLQVLVESFHAECVRNHHFPLEEKTCHPGCSPRGGVVVQRVAARRSAPALLAAAPTCREVHARLNADDHSQGIRLDHASSCLACLSYTVDLPSAPRGCLS